MTASRVIETDVFDSCDIDAMLDSEIPCVGSTLII
jgi:hypothetical protein